MLIISEQEARALVSVEDAIAVVERCFAAMARKEARNYPVVREVVGYQDAVYGVKAGCDTSAPILGLKAGGYWPHNAGKGLGNHQSSTLLFDPDTGRASRARQRELPDRRAHRRGQRDRDQAPVAPRQHRARHHRRGRAVATPTARDAGRACHPPGPRVESLA